MSGIDNEIKIEFYPELVKGNLKQGNIILSNNLPLPDSLLSIALLSPQFKEYFENESTFEALKKLAENNNVSQLMQLPIHINNGVQKAQLSDEDKRIFAKDITSKIEKLSTITNFENTFKNMGITLKFLSQALNAFRLWSKENVEGESQDGEDNQDEAEGLKFTNNCLEVTDEDESRFEMFESVVDKFADAQEEIEGLKIDSVCDFLKSKCSKYDSFYTVQEFIKFLLRNLYNYSIDFDYDYNKIMNLFIGLPIYNLDPKLRTDLITWCSGRNWPESENLTGFEDDLRNTGYQLSLWCKKLLEIFEVFQVYEFDTQQTEERTEFHKGIKSFVLGNKLLDFTYAPILSGKMDISLINLDSNVYTTQLNCKANVFDGTNLYKFDQIQVSSTSQDALNNQSFVPILQKVLAHTEIQKTAPSKQEGESFDITENVQEDGEITENNVEEEKAEEEKTASVFVPEKVYDVTDFALVSKRNSSLASFDYVDDITNPIFFGEDLFYYKIDNLKQLVRDGEKHRLLFVQMTQNYMIPLVLDKTEPLKDTLDFLTIKINSHGFEFKEEDVKNGTQFNDQNIDWELSVEDYYNKVAEIQKNQRATNEVAEVQENRDDPNAFFERDDNSRLAVMFNLKEILSTGPSYKKNDCAEQINLKINISELVTKLLKESADKLSAQENAGEEPEEDKGDENSGQGDQNNQNLDNFTSKFLTAEYIGIGTVYHSMKLDILSKFDLKSSDLPELDCFKDIDVSYLPFALLIKSYSGYELIHSAKCDGKFISTNSGQVFKKEDLIDKQIAIVYLKKQVA